MPLRLPLATALALAVGTAGSSTRSCLTNSGASGAGCDCTATGGASVCASNACVCTGGGCAGSDNKCYPQQNAQVGGAGKIYRIRNARWPDWYLESESDAAQLWVGKGKDNAAPRTYQWTLHALPTSAASTTYMMFTEYRTNHAMAYGTQRVCSVVVNGTELDLADENNTGAGDVLENDAPGPDGFQVEGMGMNGEDLALEFIVENETARALEIAERPEDDPDGDWFEGDDENEASEEAKVMSQMVRREETSYRSRYGSYYSRSRFSSYSRSRYTSYYSRSRTYYSRSRSYYSYSSYGSGHYYDYRRRRVHCRDELVGNAMSVTGSPNKNYVTMQLTRAPVEAKNSAAPLLMLSSVAYPNNYLFVPKFSSIVDINNGDPGAGGYWFFDPPLPNSEVDRIPLFTGSQCSWYCGSVGTIKDLGTAFVNKASKQAAPFLLYLSLATLGAGASLAHVV